MRHYKIEEVLTIVQGTTQSPQMIVELTSFELIECFAVVLTPQYILICESYNEKEEAILLRETAYKTGRSIPVLFTLLRYQRGIKQQLVEFLTDK